ncbi:MAG: glycosyltransferase family 4 protein [Pyrinomonadaceae bacterium]|nr:glycosyltransferase family 4 protein [Pyrinomonadaceae bacterium]
MELEPTKKTLIYALHSGNLYGTEQMALATCDGLRSEFDAWIFAPPGLAIEEAKRMNFGTQTFAGAKDFAKKLQPILAKNNELVFIATGIVHSFALIILNLFYRRKVSHLHVVHGGTDERLSYGRKKLLNFFDVKLVAVSEFVKEKLKTHGVRAEKIKVIENFLIPEKVTNCPKRLPFEQNGIKKVAIISRIDPIKRIDLLLDALDTHPELSELDFTIYGTGSEFETFQTRAAQNNLNVKFAGFNSNIAQELVKADLLLHLCPTEPFGLAILEAMAANVPVLVPDEGGAGSLVTDKVDGFHFRANNINDLAFCLNELMKTDQEILNRITKSGNFTLKTRFSNTFGIENYRRLIEENESATEILMSKGAAV